MADDNKFNWDDHPSVEEFNWDEHEDASSPLDKKVSKRQDELAHEAGAAGSVAAGYGAGKAVEAGANKLEKELMGNVYSDTDTLKDLRKNMEDFRSGKGPSPVLDPEELIKTMQEKNIYPGFTEAGKNKAARQVSQDTQDLLSKLKEVEKGGQPMSQMDVSNTILNRPEFKDALPGTVSEKARDILEERLLGTNAQEQLNQVEDALSQKERKIPLTNARLKDAEAKAELSRKQSPAVMNELEKAKLSQEQKILDYERLLNSSKYKKAQKAVESVKGEYTPSELLDLGRKAYDDKISGVSPDESNELQRKIGSAYKSTGYEALGKHGAEAKALGKEAQKAIEIENMLREAQVAKKLTVGRAKDLLTRGASKSARAVGKYAPHVGTGLGALGAVAIMADAVNAAEPIKQELEAQGIPSSMSGPLAAKLATGQATVEGELGTYGLLPSESGPEAGSAEALLESGKITPDEYQQLLDEAKHYNNAQIDHLSTPNFEDGGVANLLNDYNRQKETTDFVKKPPKDPDLQKAQQEFVLAQSPGLQRKMSDNGKQFIKSQEGFNATPRKDYAQMSYGYGSKYEPGMPTKISEQDASALLDKRIPAYEEMANKAIGEQDIPQETYDAMVSYLYNTGNNALVSKTGEPTQFAQALKAGNLESAINEMDITLAGGKRLPGLVKRRQQERDMAFKGLRKRLLSSNE